MILQVKQSDEYKGKIKATYIHGKYPYKNYLEIIGNTKIGQYIVVVGNSEISGITGIMIRVNRHDHDSNIVKPNIGGHNYITYQAKETSILSVGDREILVFEQV